MLEPVKRSMRTHLPPMFLGVEIHDGTSPSPVAGVVYMKKTTSCGQAGMHDENSQVMRWIGNPELAGWQAIGDCCCSCELNSIESAPLRVRMTPHEVPSSRTYSSRCEHDENRLELETLFRDGLSVLMESSDCKFHDSPDAADTATDDINFMETRGN